MGIIGRSQDGAGLVKDHKQSLSLWHGSERSDEPCPTPPPTMTKCQVCKKVQCNCCRTCQQIATKCLCYSVCYQQTATTTFIASLNDDHNPEQMESIKTSLGNTPARRGRGGAARGGTRGGQDRAQEEMEHKIPTFFTTMVEEIEAELQPLHKL